MNFIRKLTAAAALAGLTGLASATGYTGLYILGDSLSDAGNIALIPQIGSDPGQVITGNSYIPDHPYASNQFSNGDVWAKTFANSLGFSLAAVPSLAGGTDFAFGGARTNTDGVGLAPSLTAQTAMFLRSVGNVAPGGALYVVEGGGNDARDALKAAATVAGLGGDPSAGIASAAADYANNTKAIVDTLKSKGAQHIIVWDVPNLALAPAVTAQGPGATFLGGAVSAAMNNALAFGLASETGVTIFDLFASQTAFVSNMAAYGLTNVTDACGALGAACTPSTYLYWDGIHPTSAGHALLAGEMEKLVTAAVPEPATWALLVAGLVLVSVRARRRA